MTLKEQFAKLIEQSQDIQGNININKIDQKGVELIDDICSAQNIRRRSLRKKFPAILRGYGIDYTWIKETGQINIKKVASRIEVQDNEVAYFIVSGGMVCFGVTDDVDRELKRIQNESPVSTALVCSVPMKQEQVDAFEILFSEYYSHGAWYRNKGNLSKFLQGLTDRK